MPQAFSPLPHQIDHIIALKHLGPSTPDNLALACFFCNSYKGPNLAGYDFSSRRITRLYHPRKDRWKQHFSWEGPILKDLRRIGRVTITVLQINRPEILDLRDALIREGVFPP